MLCPKCNRVISDQHVFCSYCGNQLREGTQTASISHDIQDKKSKNKNTFLLLLSGLNLFVFLPYGILLIFSFSFIAAFSIENVSFLSNSHFWDCFLIIACLVYFIGSILFFTSSVRKSLSETKVVKSEKAKRNEKIATIILFIIVIIIITWIWILSDHFRLFFNLVS